MRSRNNHRYADVVQDLATQWIQAYPCKTKTSQETQRNLQKFLEPNRKRRVITLTMPWNLARPVKIFPGIIARLHHTDQKQMGLQERAVRRVKEGTSSVLLQSGLDEKWWADSMECLYLSAEHSQISCRMGKLHMKDVLGNHLMDQSSRLVHWLSITLFLRKTSHESINLERKSYLDCSLDTLCTRVGFGRVT